MKPYLFALPLAFLVACGSSDQIPETTVYDLEATQTALADCGGFEQVLDTLDSDMAANFYGLSKAPEEAVVYTSMEGGYEGYAILAFDSEETATTAKGEIQAYLDQMISMEQDMQYMPQDVPKLEDALLDQQGSTLLLVVAKDYDAVQTALAE